MRKLLQSQRQLRQKRLTAIKKGTVALIDLGSSKVMCLVLSLTDANHTLVLKGTEDGLRRPAFAYRAFGHQLESPKGLDRNYLS